MTVPPTPPKRKQVALPILRFSNIVRVLTVAILFLIFSNQLQMVLLDSVPSDVQDENALQVCDEALFDIGLRRGAVHLNCGNTIELSETKVIRQDTIIGSPTLAMLRLDGQHLDRLFHIETGVSLVFQNVRLENSSHMGIYVSPNSHFGGVNCAFSGHGNLIGDGAAIWNDGGAVTLDTCVFEDNQSYGDGAAIVNLDFGQLNVTNSIFRDNSVNGQSTATGAAILNDGHSLIQAVEFSDNMSLTGMGGAIMNRAGRMEIVASEFTGNRAELSGGAIVNHAGAILVLKDSTFTQNHAPVGGAFLNLGQLILSDTTTFIANTDVDCMDLVNQTTDCQ